MLRILLLDCSENLRRRLESQGFDVESGTVGLCTGIRKLPSQVYEKDVFFYNPESLPEDRVVKKNSFKDLSPEYDLRHLEARIRDGAAFIGFVNRLSNSIDVQRCFYDWIPFVPGIEFTSDKVVHDNRFSSYPQSKANYLAPIVTPASLSIPVMQKLAPPASQEYPPDVFWLFSNGLGNCLGVQILRGEGRVIFLPRYKSNEEVVETFLNRVATRIYTLSGKSKLTDKFTSPAERTAQADGERLQSIEAELEAQQEAARVQLAAATREKVKAIEADDTATQIEVYYDLARRNDDVALYYLYKIVEAIENKFGGETEGIKAVGVGAEWKAVKKLANESYRDARHAPKPGDVIKKWTEAEIKKCFEDVGVVVNAYFSLLFPPTPDKTRP
ncbi:MAG: hypothetical protein ABSA70_13765 [Terriglobia bacterium]